MANLYRREWALMKIKIKNKSLSASSLCKTASKYAMRAQTAEMASSSKQTRNPDLNTLPDQNIMNKINKLIAEDSLGFKKIFTNCLIIQQILFKIRTKSHRLVYEIDITLYIFFKVEIECYLK